MDLSKLAYTKGDSRIELPKNLAQTTSKAKRERQKTVNISHVDLAYEKQEGILSSNLFFVLSGGEKKEKDFLKELIKKPNLHSLRVVFMSKKGQGLLPSQMQEKWLKIQRKVPAASKAPKRPNRRASPPRRRSSRSSSRRPRLN